MTYKIRTELDPVFETMGLLFVSYHSEKYIQSFLKCRIATPYDSKRLYSNF